MIHRIINNRRLLWGTYFSDILGCYLHGLVNLYDCWYLLELRKFACYFDGDEHTQHPQKLNIWVQKLNNPVFLIFVQKIWRKKRICVCWREHYTIISLLFMKYYEVYGKKTCFANKYALPYYILLFTEYLNNLVPNRWSQQRSFIQ